MKVHSGIRQTSEGVPYTTHISERVNNVPSQVPYGRGEGSVKIHPTRGDRDPHPTWGLRHTLNILTANGFFGDTELPHSTNCGGIPCAQNGGLPTWLGRDSQGHCAALKGGLLRGLFNYTTRNPHRASLAVKFANSLELANLP